MYVKVELAFFFLFLCKTTKNTSPLKVQETFQHPPLASVRSDPLPYTSNFACNLVLNIEDVDVRQSIS